MGKIKNITLMYIIVAFVVVLAVNQWLVWNTMPKISPPKVTGKVGAVGLCYNNAPAILEIGNISVKAEYNLIYHINVTDVDSGNIAFSTNSTLFNITKINNSIGLINFTPSSNQMGNYSIIVTVADDSGCSNNQDSKTFNLEIKGVNRAPYLIRDIPDFEWYQGGGMTNAFDLDDYFADPDLDALYYNATGNSNVIITIDSQNNVSFSSAHVSWWYGQETVRFVANDSYLSNTSNPVTLTINQIPPTPRRGGESICIEYWQCSLWSKCSPSGQIVRRCIDLHNCGTEHSKPPVQQACTYGPTCDDRVQNQNETDIDCGGIICSKCADGKKCRVDDDCINKCNLVDKVCYTPEKPKVVKVLIPMPVEKIQWVILSILIVLMVLVLVICALYEIHRRRIALKMKGFGREKEAALLNVQKNPDNKNRTNPQTKVWGF